MSAGRVKDTQVHSPLPATFRAFPCLCCNEQGFSVVYGMVWKEPWLRQEAVIQNSTVLWNPWYIYLPRREGKALSHLTCFLLRPGLWNFSSTHSRVHNDAGDVMEAETSPCESQAEILWNVRTCGAAGLFIWKEIKVQRQMR